MKASLIYFFKFFLYVFICLILDFWTGTGIFAAYQFISYLIFTYLLSVEVPSAWGSFSLQKNLGKSMIISTYVIIDKIDINQLIKNVQRLVNLPGANVMRKQFVKVLGNTYLMDEENFSVAKHTSYYSKRNIHTQKDLVDVITEESMTLFPTYYSPWEILFIPDYEPAKSAYIFKIHHGLCDGLSMSSMFLMSGTTKPNFYMELPIVPWYLKIMPYILFPFHIAYTIYATWIKGDENCCTYHNGKPLAGEHVGSYAGPYPLDNIRKKCKQLGYTINEFMAAIIARTFSLYFEKHQPKDKPIEKVKVDIPFTYRDRLSPMELSIKIGLIWVQFPLLKGINKRQDLDEIHNILDAWKKRKCQFYSSISITWIESFLPADLLLYLAKLWSKNSTGVFTNVPGSRTPIYFEDKKVHDIQFMAPSVGEHPTSIGLYTYNEELTMMVVSDKNRMEFPQDFTKFFDEALNFYLTTE